MDTNNQKDHDSGSVVAALEGERSSFTVDYPRTVPALQKNQKKRSQALLAAQAQEGRPKNRGPPPIFKARMDLERLNQRQLVDLVQAHQTYWDPVYAGQVERAKRKHAATRELDWDKYSVRHVAFKVAYLGWDFCGLAAQVDTGNTVEGCLSEAFRKVKLFQSFETSHWSRAGRTDKGVSALGQVVACHVRSNLKSGVGIVRVGTEATEDTEELDYVTMLNGALPAEIRVLGWSPVPVEFDARFSAISRTYKYFFAKESMNVVAMLEAMKYLNGEHDFRHFCKMDTAKMEHFNRCIISATLAPIAPGPTYDPDVLHQVGSITDPFSDHWSTIYEFTISGSAFLWHQIRFMVSVLFMVGLGQEQPTIIRDLLDLNKYPQKPMFNMASEIPLILFDVGYFNLFFQIDINAQRRLHTHILEYWTERSIKSHMARLILTHIDHSDVVITSRKPRHSHHNPPVQHQVVQESPSSEATSTFPPTINVPTLISPHSSTTAPNPKREIKQLTWKSSGSLPPSIPWGMIKDQVMEVYHPRHFHQPLEERAVEESFDERVAKRPLKRRKLSETYTAEDDGNE